MGKEPYIMEMNKNMVKEEYEWMENNFTKLVIFK